MPLTTLTQTLTLTPASHLSCMYGIYAAEGCVQDRVRLASREILLCPTSSGSIPSKIFCYRSIIEAIETFVKRPGMLETFNHCKSRKIPAGVLADIYDGVVWKSFLGVDGEPFF